MKMTILTLTTLTSILGCTATCDMIQKIIVVFFCRICFLFKDYPYLCYQSRVKILRLGIKKRMNSFCSALDFFVTLALPKILRLGIKNKRVFFLLSTFS
jgi:hypothetical protein